MLDKTAIAKLLGRPLTSSEDSNFEQYIKNTTETLENLLCWSPICQPKTERTYRGRNGYRTLWTDPFTEIYSVSIDGEAVTSYEPAFNGSYNRSFYNSLEFDYPLGSDKVVIEADWGFTKLPGDLGALIAGLFQLNESNREAGVKTKRIEDFNVTYTDDSQYDAFVKANSAVIDKYSTCVNEVQSGRGSGYGRFYPL